MTMAADHKKALQDLGITRVQGLVAKAACQAARDQIIEIAKAHGAYKGAGRVGSSSRFTEAKPLRGAINALNHSEDFPVLLGEAVQDVASDLVGAPVTPLHPGQQILFTLPGADRWRVPHDVWHVDVPRLGKLGPPGLQAFTFLEDVPPEGGGTLVVAGSHKLANRAGVLRSKALKNTLSEEPYFRNLFDPKRAPITSLDGTGGRVDDVDVRVVELSGLVGDVVFMDLRVLHTPAPNASSSARLMATCRFPRAEIAEVCMAPEQHPANQDQV